jgi:DnaJ-domain-containing protein 1
VYYKGKDIFSYGVYFLHSIFSRGKRVIIFLFSLFKKSENSDRKSTQANWNAQPKQGKKKNNHQQRDQEQSQRAKEEFRKVRAEAERKKVKEESEAYTKTQGYQDTRSCEDILGLSSGYTKNELKIAYKRSVSRFHPDKYVHMSESFRAEAEEEFKKIQRAYKVLKV